MHVTYNKEQSATFSINTTRMTKRTTKHSEGISNKDSSTSEEQAPKSREKEFDPDGSMKISRGLSNKEASIQHKQLLAKSQEKNEEAIQRQLWGVAKETAQERREVLRKDDENPNLAKLNEKQKLALQNRGRKRVATALVRHETKRLQAAVAAVDAAEILQTERAGLLQAENEMERTSGLSQVALKRQLQHVDPHAASNIYDLSLSQSAPYGLEYDRSGRYSILYGKSVGHLAMMDCQSKSLVTEFTVHERVRDACFLQNFTLFAAAQKNHVFIYDHTGAEVHRLSDHNDPLALQFLPYHWLLASIGRAGWLKYQDTSTGQLVSQHRTRLGACSVLRQNPANAVLHAGHSNGTVTLWSPGSSQFLAKILCHKGASIHSLAVDRTGRTMVTGGADKQVRVWDLRMYKELHSYFTVGGIPTSLDISQRNILGIGHGCHATFWGREALREKVKDPYMHHLMGGKGPVETLRFRPFEDVCGIGQADGISSVVIPGSGEPSVDTAEYNTNPMQDAKQRQEEEVRALLDKLRPEMIALDPDQVGGIEESDPHKRLERLQDLQEAANAKALPQKKQKTKKRGRSKIQTQLRRKHKNIVDQNAIKLRELREKEKLENASDRHDNFADNPKDSAPAALRRFF